MNDVLGQPAREALGETRRQCTATNRSGQRCRRVPIVGGFVCAHHGGSIPAVREAAHRRMLGIVDPILSVFEEVVETWRATRCPTCGNPTGDPGHVIRVGQLVLDRTGFHPGVDVNVQHATAPFASYAEWIPSDRLKLMRDWLLEAKAAKDAGEQTAANVESQRAWELEAAATEVQDAVIVEPEDSPEPGE